MRHKLLLLKLLSVIFASNIYAQWVIPGNNGLPSQINSSRLISDGTYLYLGGAFRSSDNGENWTTIPATHPSAEIVFQGKLFNGYFATDSTILYSTDNGLTWSTVNGAPSSSIWGFLAADSFLFAYGPGGIYKSSDGGLNWVNKGPFYLGSNVGLGTEITMTQQNGVLLLTSNNHANKGMYRSTDYGENWTTTTNQGLKNDDYYAGFLWALGDKVYFWSESDFTYESTDQGNNWTPVTISGIPDYATLKHVSIGNNRAYFKMEIPSYFARGYLLTASASNPSQWMDITDNLPTNVQTMGSVVTEQNGFVYIGYIFSNDIVYKRDISTIITGVDDKTVNVPTKFTLKQNYPNPFNPSTNINFSVPQASFVTLKIYDTLGKEVSTLVNEQMSAGTYKFNFNASKLTSGVYFYTITANGGNSNFRQTKKMILLK